MQVFLPYPSYKKSVKVLDPKRLGNQIYRECKTLINGKWKNHPVSKMWEGYKRELCKYALAGLEELKKRGRYYPHHVKFFTDKMKTFKDNGVPFWLGNRKYHASHRSNLLRKDKDWYSKFNWKEPDNLPYVWIIKK